MKTNANKAFVFFASALCAMCVIEETSSVGHADSHSSVSSVEKTEARKALGRHASPCERYFSKYESKYKIPEGLLRAVGTHESGKPVNKNRTIVAWPWTLNVAGKGYYYPTRQKALNAARFFKNQKGVRSMDLGCMQVNIKYHPHAFKSLSEGLNPEKNVRYGAQFLYERYEATKDWMEAIADYHSRQKKEGRRYAALVLKTWKRQNNYLSVTSIAKYEERNKGIPALFMEKAPTPLAQAGAVTFETFHKFYTK